MTSSWLHVAKNEMRLWTNRFRNNRLLFFGLLVVIMGTYAFILIPLLFNALSAPIYDFLTGFIPIEGLPFFIFYVFSFALLYMFLWSIIHPLSTMLQDTGDLSGQLEVLLSSPVKMRDVLFGKLVGRLPIYLILLFIIAPWLVNFFLIAIPLTIISQILIYLTIFIIIVLSMWLGTLLAAYVENKVRKSERSRDLGKAMVFITTILTVALMYGVIWIVMTGISDPNSPMYTVLQFIPSSWGSFIIMDIFGFGYLVPVDVAFFLILLLGLTVVVLVVGYYGAGRFYSLEPIEMGTKRITSEKLFYRIFRRLGGVQLVSELKQYSRKLENFSRIGLSIGISAIVIVFNLGTSGGLMDRGMLVMFATFMYPLIIAGMLGTFVIIGSKETLWIYRKSPNGVKNYVKSVYLVHIIFTLIIGVIFSTISMIVFGFPLLDTVLSIGLSIGFSLSLMGIAIGVAFVFPTFEERGPKIAVLMVTYWGLTSSIWTGVIFYDIFVIGSFELYDTSLITLAFLAITGYILLKLGIRKLSSLE